jgi:Putative transposase
LLPVEYFHVVFTLPDDFNALALANRRVVYGVLFDAVARTLLEVAADPKHLGARVGFIGVLHTWGQDLCLHPHVHCVVPGGGLSPDGARWVACRRGFFLPVRVLSRVFRGKFVDGLKRARARGELVGAAAEDGRAFERLLNTSVRNDWVVYAKPPFGGPEQVLKYLARYTHRVAIANRRLVSVDDRTVTFEYTDYAHGSRRRTMTLDGAEFLRRFLLHAVPTGFMRIRHFGLLANRGRGERLERCRRLLGAPPPVGPAATATTAAERPCCPACGRGRLIPGPRLSAMELHRLLRTTRLDSS